MSVVSRWILRRVLSNAIGNEDDARRLAERVENAMGTCGHASTMVVTERELTIAMRSLTNGEGLLLELLPGQERAWPSLFESLMGGRDGR